MGSIEEFEHAGLNVEIGMEEDVSSFNPRHDDNLGVMVCGHTRYTLGDEQITSERFTGWSQIERYLGIIEKAVCILPLGLIDHSGIAMFVGSGAHMCDPGGWDSGQVGFIYTTRERVLEWSCGDPEWQTPERIEAALRSEVETYSAYLEGEVYYFSIQDADGAVLESCGGFVGDQDGCKNAAKEVAESERIRIIHENQIERIERDRAANMDVATV